MKTLGAPLSAHLHRSGSARLRQTRWACRIAGLLLVLGSLGTGRAADVTFLLCNDMHYGYSSTVSSNHQIAIAEMNALPGRLYPAAIGGGVIATPRAALIAGDLTDTGAAAAWAEFTNVYGLTGTEGNLHYPVCESWGNHDSGTDVKGGIKARNPWRTFLPNLSLSTNGYHYSWDWDNVHFVMLGKYPGTTDSSTTRPEDSLPFLQADLRAKVGASGRPVVVIHHYGVNDFGLSWWPAEDQATYYATLANYNTVAILHGHSHGEQIYKWNGIDVFNGEATSGKEVNNFGFMLCQITDNTLRISGRIYNLTTATWNWSQNFQKSIATVLKPALVSNAGGATGVATTAATLNGELIGTNAAPTDLYLFWGATDGGTNRAAWAHAESLGPQELGLFSRSVSNLTAEATYSYRCMASNSLGVAWAGLSASFTTLPVAVVNNTNGANQVRMTSATLNGTLAAAAILPTDVYLFWGPADGGVSKAAWANTVVLGPRSLGAFTAALSGLAGETTYYYRAYASNSIGQAWSPASSRFTTQPPVAVDNQPGPTEVTFSGATLNGTLLITNATPTSVSLFWGPADGGVSKAAWAHEIALGPRELGAFSASLSNLTIETRYFYRCYASNAVGEAWAASTWAFTSAKDFSGWPNKLQVALKGYTRSETLKDFPLLVVLNAAITNFSYNQFASPAAGDLRFGDLNDNELSYEIDKWDPSGSSYVWVKVPLLAPGNTVINAYWGNASATNPPAYTTNGAVWSEGYAGVWHMGQANALDSSANHWNGLATPGTNTPHAVASGRLGDALVCPGDGSYVTVGDIDLRTNLTMEAYYLTAAGAPVTKNALSKANSYRMNQENVDWLWFHLYGSNWYNNFQLNKGLIWAGNWHYVVMAYDGANGIQNTYVDGTLWGASTNGANPIAQNNSSVRLAENYLGTFDEVRLSSVCRSADWQWACWMTIASNTVFSSYRMLATNTPAPVTRLDNAAGASNVTTTGATLNGYLASVSDSPTYVWFYWGPTDGGTNPAAWDSSVALGATSLGACSAVLSGLTGDTLYYYRAFASNAAASVWAPASAAFTTLGVRPMVVNGTASAVTVNAATLNGNLTYTGASPASVTLYWGPADGATNPAAWANSLSLGPRNPGPLAAGIAGLANATTYYYRFYAANAQGDNWASPSVSFTTPSGRPDLANSPATAITAAAATLNGQLLSTGAAPASVWLYWGTNDGATLKANWQAVVPLGPRLPGTLATDVTNLLATTRYYYRFLGSNAYGETWAATTESFMTGGTGGNGGTWAWDKGGDGSTWASAGNWYNVTAQSDNDGYPNAPGTVANNLNGIVVLNPNDATVGELYCGSGFQLGTDVTPASTLTLDNSGSPAIWRLASTSAGNVYNHLNLASDLLITNTSTATLQVFRRNITGPGKNLHITTLGSGGVTISCEDPATSYNTFSNLYLHANCNFTARETARSPARSPLGTGAIYLEPGATLNVVLRLWATNNLQLLGNARLTYTDDRAQGVQLDGSISGPGQLTFQHNDTSTAAGNFYLGGSAPNTYSGGTVVIGDNTANAYGALVLRKNGATGTGDVILTNEYAKLQITHGGATDDRINDAAALRLYHAGTAYAKVTLDSGVNETIGGLYFDGVAQPAGTYGSSASSAAHQNDNWFSGSGVLTVAPNPDSDGDGLADAWELAHFGNLTAANATTDFDHDGQSDLMEYRAGTDPKNSASVFAFTESSYSAANGALVLKWQSVAGKQYTLEQATDLLGGHWQVLSSNLLATPPLNVQTTFPSMSQPRFYRISTQ